MSERRSAFDLVECFHLTHAVAALKDCGVFDAMQECITVEQLARQFGFEPVMLGRIVQFVARRTNLLECRDGSVCLSENFDDHATFLLDQYVGAYGPNAAQLADLLTSPERAGELVDRERHASAFARVGPAGIAMLRDFARQLELNNVLDLGCGPGTLLLELAQSNGEFRGWGVDASAKMCELATRRAAESGVSDRLRFFQGDAARFQDCVPGSVLDQVAAVTAASLLNEFFGADANAATKFLQSLRERLPARTLLVSDYYGCLGSSDGQWFDETALHDFVQVISGQGVPPPDLASWQSLYSDAGCGLVHALEYQHASGFIHVVRL
jgi:SAM-dependent methyltransferase